MLRCADCGTWHDSRLTADQEAEGYRAVCVACLVRVRSEYLLQVAIDIRYHDGSRLFDVFELVREHSLSAGTVLWRAGLRYGHRETCPGASLCGRQEAVAWSRSVYASLVKPKMFNDALNVHSHSVGFSVTASDIEYPSAQATDIGWVDGAWRRLVTAEQEAARRGITDDQCLSYSRVTISAAVPMRETPGEALMRLHGGRVEAFFDRTQRIVLLDRYLAQADE